MADKTGIEWTDATWNPIVGCTIVSPGCTNCYAMSMAARIDAMQPGSHYARTTVRPKSGAVWTGNVALAPDHILAQPLRWRRPRKIFVNSMGDLFHESVPDEWIDRVFAGMALSPQHTFQVLTKRSARMRAYFAHPALYERVYGVILGTEANWPALPRGLDVAKASDNLNSLLKPGFLRNVWLGVSAEDQRRADERIPDLLDTPAAIRFASAEPLLGPIEFRDVDGVNSLQRRTGPTLDLVIAGGESGPRARPMHPDWARGLRDQCADSGVPFFFKQWGEWAPRDWCKDGGTHALNRHPGHTFQKIQSHPDSIERVGAGPDWQAFARVGKRAASRLLDGVEHNGMPEVRP